MQCPNCKSQELVPAYARKGLEIDRCPACQGVWLDKGEINHFLKNPSRFHRKFSKALSTARPSGRKSPRTGDEMLSVDYPGGPTLDYCKSTGGLWFDGGEIRQLREGEIRVEEPEGAGREIPRAAAGGPLVALPNLFIRSATTLFGLYALLIGVMIVAGAYFDLDSRGTLIGGAIFVTITFLISPFLLDLQLSFLFKITWVQPDDLPDHLRRFVESVCARKGIPFPRVGVLDDGAPQAFTYGHRPGNARIVISRGLVELTEPDELEAVVAHEIGHAVHWDMFLMSAAQLVPLVLYYIYRMLIRVRSSGRDKSAAARVAIAAAAFLLYLISEYVVLWFSRTREYHADRFAGEVTGKPDSLARALVKIAYGLAGNRSAQGNSEETEDARHSVGGAVGAMGIFDAKAATGLAIASYSAAGVTPTFSREGLRAAMRWDLWNPWAWFCELGSTHPLVANRLQYLANQARHMGQEPLIEFDERRPESYWDEFLVDFTIWILPWVSVLAAVLGLLADGSTAGSTNANLLVGVPLTVLGIAVMIRLYYSYPSRFFPEMTVSSLLGRVKVSRVRAIPCTLKGTIIGRGVPGYILSEDFVIKDETGIIFLDYQQPLALWNMLFGLLRGEDFMNCEAVVTGWYRRFPVPYIEVSRLFVYDKWWRCWAPMAKVVFAFALVAAGIFLIGVQPLDPSMTLYTPAAGG